MRICLIAPAQTCTGGPADRTDALARLLRRRHEVELLRPQPDPDLAGVAFAAPAHRRAAWALGAIRAAYPERGPDYVEVRDGGVDALVALQGRAGGDPLLAETRFGVRVGPSAELTALHDAGGAGGEAALVGELEREQLRLADHLVWPGGEWLELYRRHYGPVLPEPVRIPAAHGGPVPDPPPPPPPPGPLRLLYAGDLARRLGALDLAEACFGLPFDEWELTMAGADTETAAMRQSVRLTIEAITGGDPRLRLEDELAPRELRRRLPAYDLLVAPGRLGDGAAAVLEAMRVGVPVLATAVGEQAELVEDGVTGWRLEGAGVVPLRAALTRLAGEREALARIRGSGAIAARFTRLTDPERVLDGYERLRPRPRSRSATASAPPDRAGDPPWVTGVVPYHRAHTHVAEAVASLLGQSHRDLDVVIVNDGSFEPEDDILDELARNPRVTVVTQPNAGEAAARALGVTLARGEYVTLLDADNLLERGFVEQALRAIRRDPGLAYVTCWLRMVGPDGAVLPGRPGYAPLGNGAIESWERNWDGDTIALLPRRLLVEEGLMVDRESSMHSDWEQYRLLRTAGRHGTVIPDLLARYRVLPDSLLRSHAEFLQQRGSEESQARVLLRRLHGDAEGAT